jgi:hypothetical protein
MGLDRRVPVEVELSRARFDLFFREAADGCAEFAVICIGMRHG